MQAFLHSFCKCDPNNRSLDYLAVHVLAAAPGSSDNFSLSIMYIYLLNDVKELFE